MTIHKFGSTTSCTTSKWRNDESIWVIIHNTCFYNWTTLGISIVLPSYKRRRLLLPPERKKKTGSQVEFTLNISFFSYLIFLNLFQFCLNTLLFTDNWRQMFQRRFNIKMVHSIWSNHKASVKSCLHLLANETKRFNVSSSGTPFSITCIVSGVSQL